MNNLISIDDYIKKVDLGDEFIKSTANDVAKATDDYILKQFIRHGYSKEKVLELLDKNRIRSVMSFGGETYLIDDKPLFSIKKETELIMREPDKYTYTTTFTCEDLCPVPEKEEVCLKQ